MRFRKISRKNITLAYCRVDAKSRRQARDLRPTAWSVRRSPGFAKKHSKVQAEDTCRCMRFQPCPQILMAGLSMPPGSRRALHHLFRWLMPVSKIGHKEVPAGRACTGSGWRPEHAGAEQASGAVGARVLLRSFSLRSEAPASVAGFIII